MTQPLNNKQMQHIKHQNKNKEELEYQKDEGGSAPKGKLKAMKPRNHNVEDISLKEMEVIIKEQEKNDGAIEKSAFKGMDQVIEEKGEDTMRSDNSECSNVFDEDLDCMVEDVVVDKVRGLETEEGYAKELGITRL